MFSYGFTSKGSTLVTLAFILFIIFICMVSPKNPLKFITMSDCLSTFFSHIGHLFAPDVHLFNRCVVINCTIVQRCKAYHPRLQINSLSEKEPFAYPAQNFVD